MKQQYQRASLRRECQAGGDVGVWRYAVATLAASTLGFILNT